MTKPYRELVAVQATFSKTKAEYNLTHYYKWQSDEWTSGGHMIVGYDMDRAEKVEDITLAIRTAYAGATITIWKEDGILSNSEMLSFKLDVTPETLDAPGTWTLFATP